MIFLNLNAFNFNFQYVILRKNVIISVNHYFIRLTKIGAVFILQSRRNKHYLLHSLFEYSILIDQ